MSSEAERVMRSWFEEVWNEGRDEAIDRYLDTESVAYGLPQGPMRGPAGFRPFYQSLRLVFPDIRVEVGRAITEGDRVALHCRVSATHTGAPMMGVAPTGKRVTFDGMVMALVEGGRCREAWNCFDFLSLYQQLGLAPG
ncbi:MAG: ester cyclase [Vicinamibacterales bacterium]